jgi:hypothetical protein
MSNVNCALKLWILKHPFVLDRYIDTNISENLYLHLLTNLTYDGWNLFTNLHDVTENPISSAAVH